MNSLKNTYTYTYIQIDAADEIGFANKAQPKNVYSLTSFRPSKRDDKFVIYLKGFSCIVSCWKLKCKNTDKITTQAQEILLIELVYLCKSLLPTIGLIWKNIEQHE